MACHLACRFSEITQDYRACLLNKFIVNMLKNAVNSLNIHIKLLIINKADEKYWCCSPPAGRQLQFWLIGFLSYEEPRSAILLYSYSNMLKKRSEQPKYSY